MKTELGLALFLRFFLSALFRKAYGYVKMKHAQILADLKSRLEVQGDKKESMREMSPIVKAKTFSCVFTLKI